MTSHNAQEKTLPFLASRMLICNNFSTRLRALREWKMFIVRKETLNYKCRDCCCVFSLSDCRCRSDYQGKQIFLLFHIKRAMHNKWFLLINFVSQSTYTNMQIFFKTFHTFLLWRLDDRFEIKLAWNVRDILGKLSLYLIFLDIPWFTKCVARLDSQFVQVKNGEEENRSKLKF